MAEKRPDRIELYPYNVYFGDCFLLIFFYPDDTKRSVLIDFGSTGKGKQKTDDSAAEPEAEGTSDSTGERLLRIAKHISATCGKKLDVVVATHRHKDHIQGFGLKDAGKIILDCEPEMVIQPWTEDPADNRDLTKKKALLDPEKFKVDQNKQFAAMLDDMHSVAGSIEAEANHLGNPDRFTKTIDPELRDKIVFAADNNQQPKNLGAIKNLQKIKQPHYVYFGYDKIKWDEVLPGVNVRILGPPRLEDYPKITAATGSSDEFWSLLAVSRFFWGVLAATNPSGKLPGDRKPLFGPHLLVKDRPANIRWFIRRLRDVRATQLFELVRFVDRALNNTSVILLFEIGDQKLLFPGDAQIENWQFLLDTAKKDSKLKKLLDDTTLYKVGHHGSRNATPKSLWANFKKRSPKKAKGRLRTVVSTVHGKHGESPDTEVPLQKMMTAMQEETDFTSTENFSDGFVEKLSIKITY